MKKLADAEIGDPLVIITYKDNKRIITKISRVTKTQVTSANGFRFIKRSGEKVGGGSYSYHNPTAYIPDEKELQDLRDSIKIQNMRRRLERINWRKVPTENIRAMHKLAKDLGIKSEVEI